eukprot:TRINITY_DN10783_c0_g1_i1.p1 TRINITY_DN10783_c0_g1~~TRINITY_DN10783_c0_g1_i1.p1  ORF type:complete len:196 (-),score=45.68 TRINITY_DN10783_c0_g1_i1:218-805(-)
MLKFMELVRKKKDRKNDGKDSSVSSPQSRNGSSHIISSSSEEILKTFSEQEKKEIATTLHLCLTAKNPDDKEEIYGTFCMNSEVREEDLVEAKNYFVARDPEAWERNILKLEKGEFDDEMPELAFKRWKKDRPQLNSIFQSPEDLTSSGSKLRDARVAANNNNNGKNNSEKLRTNTKPIPQSFGALQNLEWRDTI